LTPSRRFEQEMAMLPWLIQLLYLPSRRCDVKLFLTGSVLVALNICWCWHQLGAHFTEKWRRNKG
jgi:hypothetical protein